LLKFFLTRFGSPCKLRLDSFRKEEKGEMDLKDIKPRIRCAVGHEELFTFDQVRGDLMDHLREQLKKLSEKSGKKYEYTIEITREGDIVCYKRLDKEVTAGFVADNSRIQAEVTSATSFDFFEREVPDIFVSLLNFLEKNNVSFLGMMFCSNFFLRKEIDAIQVLESNYFRLAEKISTSTIEERDIHRLSFELRFKQEDYTRHLIVRAGKAESTENGYQAEITFDSRIEKEMEVKDTEMLSEFFKETALNYFMDNIVNGFVKEIFEAKQQDSTKK